MRWSNHRLALVAALACLRISAPIEGQKSAQPTTSGGRAVIVAQEKDARREMPWRRLKLIVRSGVYEDSFLLTRQEHSVPVIRAPSTEARIETSACHFASPSGPLSLCRGLDALLRLSRASVHVTSDAPVSALLRRRSFRRALVSVNVTRLPVRYRPEEESGFLRRRRRSVPFHAATPYVVRLLLLVGVEDKYNRTVDRAVDRAVAVINFVNAAFRDLGVTFAVVRLKVDVFQAKWGYKQPTQLLLNRISTEHTAGVDCVHLLCPLSLGESGAGAGEAQAERMCGGRHCTGFTLQHDFASQTSFNAAFFLGRSLGLPPDTDPEDCQNCLMSNAASRVVRWSRRSRETLPLLLGQGLARCLRPGRTPSASVLALCGNGVVEAGEECDCGPPDGPGCRDNHCCAGERCRRAAGAACASGRCCDLSRCALRPTGHRCRGARGPCDLSEFCNGTGARCPRDLHRSDGAACSPPQGGGNAFCFAGECRSRASWCRALWGETADEAPPKCFDRNRWGSDLGDCGTVPDPQYSDSHIPVACERKNLRCGRLWCAHRSEKSFAYGVIKETSVFSPTSGHCTALEAAGAVAGRDPGYVPDYADCGKGRVCLNFSCVPLTSLAGRSECHCHGRGSCNNVNQCHCDYGYAPPDCLRLGTGGSIGSGPPPPRHRQAFFLNTAVVAGILVACAIFSWLFVHRRFLTRRNVHREITMYQSSAGQEPERPDPHFQELKPPARGRLELKLPTGARQEVKPPTGRRQEVKTPTGARQQVKPPTGGRQEVKPPTGGRQEVKPPTGSRQELRPPTGKVLNRPARARL